MNKGNKRIALFIFCIWYTTCDDSHIDTIYQKETESIPIHRTTHLVFRRYYFIARLEKTIKLLEKINGIANKQELRMITNIQPSIPFLHDTIHMATRRMRTINSLRPIFSVWEDFSSYKSLESEIVIDQDGLFVKEFTQQLFFITKNILTTLYHEQNILKKYNALDIQMLTPEQIVDILDNAVDSIEKPYSSVQKDKQVNDIKVHATSDEINLRFYHICRLESAIQMLEQIKKEEPELFNRAIKKSKQIKTDLQPSHIDDPNAQVQDHDEIHTSDDILEEWQNFRQYRRIGEHSSAKDFFVLAFTVFKEIHQAKNLNQSFTLDEVISKTDPEDILYAIDVISDEIQAAVHVYQKDGDTFCAWIQKKWWIPLVVLSTIGLKITHHFFTKLSTR